MQLQLDVGTPAGVVDEVLRAVRGWVEARRTEYGDFCEVFVTSMADPLKLGLEIVYFYAHPGLSPPGHHAVLAPLHSHLL